MRRLADGPLMVLFGREPKEEVANEMKRFPFWKRCLRMLWRLLLTYVAILICGLWPVNVGFRNDTSQQGITIYVTSNPVHAELILPTDNAVVNWRELFPADDFKARRNDYSHIAFGWGDHGFYVATPEWKDFRLGTAAHAILWPSRTVMHVQFTHPRSSASCRPVTLSPEQYRELVDYVRNSFAFEDGRCQRLQDAAYGRVDAFYLANGRYHALNTCNSWVGRGLKRGGVCVPWLSPLPKTVLWYLPEQPEG